MVRTTVYLPEQLKRELASRARAEGRTEADVIRESLERTLRPSGRTLADLSYGAFGSGHSDTSERVDEVLGEAGFGHDG